MNLYGSRATEIPTLGVEEEYQIINAATRELSSDTRVLLSEGAALYGDHIRPEFHSPVVEVVTTPCSSPREISEQITELRRTMIGLGRKHGLAVAAASTHPVTHWRDVKLTDGERYLQISRDMGDVVRSNLIYGMHCHIGIADGNARIHVMNQARFFIPHLIALTCSSPFWQSRDTGLASTRTAIFRRFPRTGLPEHFESHREFEEYVALLVATGSIDNAKRIYWDIRPHPFYPTIEFRACDLPTKVKETTAVVALIQCLCTRFLALYRRDMSMRVWPRNLVNENVYRAYRYGVKSDFIDLPTGKIVPFRDIMRNLLDDLAEEVRLLQCEGEMAEIYRIIEHGNSADRQRAVFAATGSLEKVVDHLIAETAEGVV